MIEIIDKGMNENVVAVSARGKVTHEDYTNVLIPEVEQKIGGNAKVRLFYHLGEEVTGFELGALWDDARTGLQHFTAFEKIAVVTDITWIKDAIIIFGFFKPCPVRTFPNSELEEAAAWINT